MAGAQVVCREAFEGRALHGKLGKLDRADWAFDRIGHGESLVGDPRAAVDLHEPIGIGERKRTQHHAIDDTED
jgi:hypothetical protein